MKEETETPHFLIKGKTLRLICKQKDKTEKIKHWLREMPQTWL